MAALRTPAASALPVAVTGAGLLAVFWLHLASFEAGLSWPARWQLVWGADAEAYLEARFLFSDLPRAVIAVLAGAALGVAGSAIQQLTQNPLASPLTLGTAAGAWLGIVIGAVFAPELLARSSLLFSLPGGLLATAIALGVARRHGLDGPTVVVVGMALTLALGAVASLLILANEGYVDSWFIWGSGDLTQVDWTWVTWLAPQVALGTVLLLGFSRALAVIQLGHKQAAALGLAVVPTIALGLVLAVWLTASTISAVGLIGFVGLLAPHIARFLVGPRPAIALAFSAVIGAIALLVTDALAVWVSQHSRDLVTSGAATALIGAPSLLVILLTRKRVHVARPQHLVSWDRGQPRAVVPAVLSLTLLAVAASVFVGVSDAGLAPGWPSELQWAYRAPRLLGAVAAGAGMALAGLVLQRLFRNPLVSPDIVGISSGASLALLIAFTFFGVPFGTAATIWALVGGFGAIALLVAAGWRLRNSIADMVLVGLSLYALSDALLQFVIAQGGEDSYRTISWLSGSTLRIEMGEAAWLTCAVLMLAGVIRLLARDIALLDLGDAAARARGLPVTSRRIALLVAAAALASLITAVVGPIAFVGLLAPHLARSLGARNIGDQLTLSLLLGAALFVTADWVSRVALYPAQLPPGAVCAVLGGTYLCAIMLRRPTR
ncbi:MAG: Fe(3+)-hydroxamate ABC transporter permease FhuB [Pseudomonadota bacterium]